MSKTAEAFRTISEVADDLDVPKHVLRFWEAKFPQVRPMKRGGGRRYYRPEDMELLRGIRHLLHAEGYTIKGVQKILREHGVEHVKAYGRSTAPVAAAAPVESKRRGRSEQPAMPATPVEARNAPSRKGQGATKAAARAVPAMSLQAALKAAIAELETCRRLLRQDEQPATKAMPKGRVARARSTGS